MSRPTYRFGDCRIDVSARELRRAGELVVLSPKVFDCLAYLIERHDRAVGRDELVAAVWGKTQITDTLLGQTILKARRAIGDSADEQNAIRTIPRFGYAWVAAFADDEADDRRPTREVAHLPSPPRSAERLTDPRWAWLAIVAMIAVAGFWVVRHTKLGDGAVPIAADSAAVLPVDVHAPAEWSWVRLGLMDAIAARLREGEQAVVPSDNVIALTRAASKTSGGAEVSGATGAKFLVVPSATWSASGWNVRLELHGGGTSRNVEARNVDVLLAGREAADRLLVLVGKHAPAGADDPQAWADAKLLQRAEAALLTGDLDGARRLLQSAPAALQQSPELSLRLAKIDFRAGELDAAEQRLHGLLAQTPAETDPVMRARILNGLGHVALRLDRGDDAMKSYTEAVSLLENRNEPGELGQAYMGRGSVAQTQGRYDEALADFSKAHVAFELAGDGLALARIEANEGMLDAARDRYAAAAPALERAAQRFERFGTLNELAMTTNAEIGAHLALLEPRQALAASERAWTVRDRLENPRVRDALSINRALALAANGRRQDARALLTEVIRVADPAREKTLSAVARGELARIEWASGNIQPAIELAVNAIAALERSEDARDALPAWLSAIRSLRAAGRASEADDYLVRFDAWARSTSQPAMIAYSGLARAEQLDAADRNTEAGVEYERALALASQADVPADVAEVAVSYGSALIADGRLERASAVIGQVARWSERDFGCALLQLRLYAALGQRSAWETALSRARAIAGDREIPTELTALSASPTAARLPP